MGLTINVDYDPSVAAAPAGFKTTVAAVVSYLESQFSNPITITIDVGYGEDGGERLAGSDLGESSSNGIFEGYQTVRAALRARSSTPAEIAAAQSLPASDPTDGASFYLAYAEAAALGLSPALGQSLAGSIGISSTEPFTWGTTNGAAPNTFDAFGTIEHEITEAMGRTAELGAESGTFTPMDLFRYASPGVRDLAFTSGFFSANGQTLLDQWNNPRNGGDAGDWSSNVADDAFDAFSAEGVANPITPTDLELMDVLGYTPSGVSKGAGAAVSVVSVTASPAAGDITTGVPITFTVTMGAAVTISGGAPTLSLNDGGTATYQAGLSTATSLVFAYTAQSGQSTAALAVSGLNANGASIQTAGTSAILSGAQTTLSGLAVNIPLINGLSVNQQLELIYIGYFDRAADGTGFTFWAQQNTQAQAGGESSATSLTAIADAFTPQAETLALYPFLNGNNGSFATPATQSGLRSFINSVYANLFDHAADPAGAAYWFGQISGVAIGLGAAILAIANGAVGTDANILQNKITVALGFTNATSAAGLEGSGASSAAFLATARGVLSGVDGTALDDASVVAGLNQVSAYVASQTNAALPAVGASDAIADPSGDPLIVSLSNNTIDPGQGGHQIQFIAGIGDDTLVLHAGGTDVIGGFAPSSGDVLSLSSLFAEAGVNINTAVADIGAYLKVVDQGADAVLLFDPAGQSGGTPAAILRGLGGTVTSLGVLMGHDAIQV